MSEQAEMGRREARITSAWLADDLVIILAVYKALIGFRTRFFLLGGRWQLHSIVVDSRRRVEVHGLRGCFSLRS